MTDKKRYGAKVTIGADEEAEGILNKLPRKRSTTPNGFIYIDAGGRLIILLDGGGILTINERDLIKVHGDQLYEG